MYLIVFCLRYIDIFYVFYSVYNTTMKIIYIGVTILIIYLMGVARPYSSSYDSAGDAFPHIKVILPISLLLSVWFNQYVHLIDFLRQTSWWIEVFVLVPQIVMLRNIRNVENLTGYYVTCLGLYRFFYMLKW